MKKLAIGVDIGGTRTKIGLVNLAGGRIIHMMAYATEKKDAALFLDKLCAGIAHYKQVATRLNASLGGVGIGVTGFVHQDGSVDSTYGFLEFMEDYPLRQYVEEETLLPCRADNDARVVALGEALYGQGKGHDRALTLTLGTGLGVGFVVGGKFDSPLAFAHMAGHMAVASTGNTCYCGKKGCLESLASATGIVDAAKRLGWAEKYPAIPLNVKSIFEAEQNGNADAAFLVEDFLHHLRLGLGNYINIYVPDVIVLGGGVSKGMKPYLNWLQEGDYLKPYKRYQVHFRLSELDEHAGVLGSAALFNHLTK